MESYLNSSQNNHQAKAWGISALIYILLLFSLYLIKIVYQAPVEDIALGVDLNYGVDLVGSGNIQTLNQANDSKNDYDVLPAKSKAAAPKPSNLPPAPKVEKSVAAKSVPSKIITADEDTKVSVKPSTDNSKNSSNSVVNNKTETKKSTPASPPAATQPKVDNGSIFKKPSSGSSNSNGTVGAKSGIGGNNNGDGKPGEVGDKGDPRGTLDGKSLYGNPGKGGGTSGASVSISGWKNKGPLNIPKDQSSETGRIKFKVIIDDFGDVQRIDVIESSLSPSVTNYYKNQITSKLKSNLVPEGTPPPRSTGTITINITRGA